MGAVKRTYAIIGLVGTIVGVSIAATLAMASADSGSGGDDADGEGEVASGQIEDGKELLGLTTITLEDAIAAAQRAADGGIGEIDVECYNGTLIFNVDVGQHDVKVDASNGSVLGSVADADEQPDGDKD